MIKFYAVGLRLVYYRVTYPDNLFPADPQALIRWIIGVCLRLESGLSLTFGPTPFVSGRKLE